MLLPIKKRWKCSYCRRKYSRIGIWLFRHFAKVHPDKTPKAEDIQNYACAWEAKPVPKEQPPDPRLYLEEDDG